MDAHRIAAFLDSVGLESGGPELHSLMIVRHGSVVAEGWWHPYRPDVPHELYSLSKSFLSTAVGFAQAEGLLTVDDLLLDHVGDEAPEDLDPALRRMRLRHLLTMTTGHEDAIHGPVFGAERWVRTFLTMPVPHEPGTHFMYNTVASYVLAAIVERRAGQRLLDYLTPRLLDPLGIDGATWEQSPEGHDVGGWGMSVTTEDIACFGQLYLNGGVWQGRQLLPEGWAVAATAKQVPSVHSEVDWSQGYGYQFWQCRHGAVRGDGAFGQFCVMLPGADAVVAITSGTPDLQGVLNRVWEHLLPAFDGPGPDAAAADDALAARLDTLSLPVPVPASTGDSAEPLIGRTIIVDPNPFGVQEVTVTAVADGVPSEVVWRTAGRTETLPVGAGQWAMGSTRRLDRDGTLRGLLPDADHPVAAAAAWTAPGRLTVQVRFYDTPYCLTAEVACDGDRVRGTGQVNVSFEQADPVELTGVIAPR